MKIKAIETNYNGYKFRSRLEARWAVFFEALGIPYKYEPEGFDLDGVWYLPDFWLEDQELWIEIKPVYPTFKEQYKAYQLAKLKYTNVVILSGEPWVDPKLVEECKGWDHTWHKYQGIVFYGNFPHEKGLQEDYPWEDLFENLRIFLFERTMENLYDFSKPITQEPLSENVIRELMERDKEYYYRRYARPHPHWILGRRGESYLWGHKNGEYKMSKIRGYRYYSADDIGALDAAVLEAYGRARKERFQKYPPTTEAV